ncbi:annexin VII [Thermus caldifontis]|uniref:annexin VII n=1 Tax=Thermus caldifontis TaxID=1930763 RepID=UPI000DF2F408|nr:annexin VII [Thermus caldifontis]
MRHLTHREAESRALKILVDGLGEGLVVEGEGGYYALYYFYGWYGRKAPDPEETPDWVEGPRPSPEGFRDPYDQARWLEDNGYTLFINESK